MLKLHSKSLSFLHRLIDLTIHGTSFFITLYCTINVNSYPLDHLYSSTISYARFIIIYCMVWLFVSTKWEIYLSKRITAFREEAISLVKASLSSCVIAYFICSILQFDNLQRNQLVLFIIINLSLLLFFRICLRKILRFFRAKGFNFRNVILVGKNERSSLLANRILEEEKFGLNIIGYIDNSSMVGLTDNFPDQIKYLGEIDELETILNNHVVDEVFIALPIKSFYETIDDIVQICSERGIGVRIASSLFHLKKNTLTADTVYNLVMINFTSGLDDILNVLFKRIFDIFMTSFLILLFMPLFILVPVLIKLDSPGPVFFRQERVGCNNRRFKLLKFRSMINDADQKMEEVAQMNEMNGPVFKMKNDPRVTRLGKFLRSWSIDELPQLINVLMNDMSLVGPRPPLAREVENYLLFQRRRLSVKPGITGLWQVSGRNNLPFEDWIRLDLEYIDNWTISLDFKILFRTVFAVLGRKGAM